MSHLKETGRLNSAISSAATSGRMREHPIPAARRECKSMVMHCLTFYARFFACIEILDYCVLRTSWQPGGWPGARQYACLIRLSTLDAIMCYLYCRRSPILSCRAGYRRYVVPKSQNSRFARPSGTPWAHPRGWSRPKVDCLWVLLGWLVYQRLGRQERQWSC
jgi:hypothetical protein